MMKEGDKFRILGTQLSKEGEGNPIIKIDQKTEVYHQDHCNL